METYKNHYCPTTNTTFVMKYTTTTEDGDLIEQAEVIGFYFGKPEENRTQLYIDEPQTVSEPYVTSKGADMNIKKIEAIYTGGGIWIFFGAVDENYFMMDDYGCVLILDEDPTGLEELGDAFEVDWQEKHTIRELMDEERATFQDLALDKLLEEDEATRGPISEDEINHYRTYFKEPY